jgi:hypothetical protein
MSYYKGKSDEDLVKNHKYYILTKDGKSSVQASNWGFIVKNGAVLVMTWSEEKLVLVDKGRDQAQRYACPYCSLTDLGLMADEGWLQW